MPFYAIIEMSESQYNTYLGDNVNSIEVTEHTIVAETGDMFSRAYPFFEASFGEGYIYTAYRLAYPWSGDVQAFSEAEAELFADNICNDISLEQYLSVDGAERRINGNDTNTFILLWLFFGIILCGAYMASCFI